MSTRSDRILIALEADFLVLAVTEWFVIRSTTAAQRRFTPLPRPAPGAARNFDIAVEQQRTIRQRLNLQRPTGRRIGFARLPDSAVVDEPIVNMGVVTKWLVL